MAAGKFVGRDRQQQNRNRGDNKEKGENTIGETIRDSQSEKRQAGRRQTVGEKKLINLKGWSQSPAQQSNGRLSGETYLQEQIYIQN